MHRNDEFFTARRLHMRRLARRLMDGSKCAKRARTAVAKEIAQLEPKAGEEDVSKEDHKKQVDEIRKKAGNMLLLSPSLMNNHNFFNSRVMLLGGRLLWTEQSTLAKFKVTPGDELTYAINLSLGAGECILRKLWKQATHSPLELARLGIEVVSGYAVTSFAPGIDPDTGLTEPGVEKDSAPERLMSFILHIIETRFWWYAQARYRYPRAFASIGSNIESEANIGLDEAKRHFEDCALAESAQNHSPGISNLRKLIYWQSWPINQTTFRFLAHFHFKRHPTVHQHIRRRFKRVGDTKPVEETAKLIHSNERYEQPKQTASLIRGYHKMTLKKTPLEHRGIPHIEVPASSHYEQKGSKYEKPSKSWAQLFGQRRVEPLPKEWNCRNVLKSKKPYTTKTVQTARASIAAAQALQFFLHRAPPSLAVNAWQTCALSPHTLVQLRARVELEGDSQEHMSCWGVT